MQNYIFFWEYFVHRYKTTTLPKNRNTLEKAKAYRIVGIDPGTNVLGYAVIEIVNKKVNMLELGEIKMKHLETHHDKLKYIYERIQTIIEIYQPNQMAIEAPFFGKNVQSMLKLGRAQGAAIVSGMTKGLEVTEYAPRKIKQSITGNGNASKEQVAAMLNNILDQTINEVYLDATDALAAAVCHYFQSGNPLSGQKRYKGWDNFINENKGRVRK